MLQTALAGKTLLLSVKAHVTSGFFKDVTGHDTLEAQLCGLENIRLWQDPETKAVQAMVRYTTEFKDKYLTFYRTFAHLVRFVATARFAAPSDRHCIHIYRTASVTQHAPHRPTNTPIWSTHQLTLPFTPVNSTRQPIYMQAESHRAVRLGGLTVPLEPTTESLLTRRAQSATALVRPTRHRYFLPERTTIRAVQIVFSSELDKALFSTALEEAQMFCFDG